MFSDSWASPTFIDDFVEGFSKIAAPMNKLLRKDQEVGMEGRAAEGIEELKVRFTTNPILITADPEKTAESGVRCIRLHNGSSIIYEV